MNRVSKISVKDVLSKYLDDDLRDDILNAIEDATDAEAASVCGMSLLDFFHRFDDDTRIVWAADSGGFGKAGDPVYGNLDGLRIVGFVGLPGRGKGISLMVWWDWKDWKDADKRFVITDSDGNKKDCYAKCWEDAAKITIADGMTDFTVSRWIGVDYDGHDLTERVGRVSCGSICKRLYGPAV